jgi:hypothetical protein
MLSETVPLMDSGIPRFMIIKLSLLERSHLSKCRISSVELSNVISIGCGNLNAKSKSMQPRIIRIFSFQSLKFVPLSIGTLVKLTIIADVEAKAEIKANE